MDECRLWQFGANFACTVCRMRLSNEAPQLPSSSTLPALSTRDVFLDSLFTLKPEVLIVGENDSDQSSPDFLTRLKDCVNFWWCFSESAEAGYADIPDSEDRLITGNEGGMILLNNVACEKAARIERNEPQANCVSGSASGVCCEEHA